MLEGARIAVVVPAHDEAFLIGSVLDTIPSFVDVVVVVDDASTDRTASIVANHPDRRVQLIRHAVNRGVGAAIASGYRLAYRQGVDIVAVMAGDGQMDPLDLPNVLRPVLDGVADYAKGNRLRHPDARTMPPLRRFGTRLFAWATGAAIGNRGLSDSQCGYTAISARAIERLDLHRLWPRFGYPNDLLCQLAMRRLRTMDVLVRPVYGIEKSELRPRHGVTIAWLIARAAWRVRGGRDT
jgi:glycosyltransferase involved in cell wall biosynthesis